MMQVEPDVSELDLVYKLTGLADINRLLHETYAKERTIEGELEALQNKRVDIEGSLISLQASTSELLDLAKADAEQLAGSVHNTSALSEKVSKKVRELDTSQSRIQETLTRINRLVDRTNAIDGVQQALASQDYEAAAKYVASYLELQEELGPKSGSASLVQADEQEKVLEDARGKVLQAVRSNLPEAEKKQDHATVLRFVKLYAPLGAKEEGIAWFSRYLQKLVSERAKEDYSALVESTGTEIDFVTALTNLLQDIGTALQQNEDMLMETFGTASLLQLVEGLQRECDEHGARLLQRFIRQRHLEQLVKDIHSHSALKRNEATRDAASPVDPPQLEGYLEEMLVLCQRSEEYNQFMLGKMAEGAAPKLLTTVQENAFRSGPFNTAVRELIAYYINMEEYYLEQNVEKAIEIDEWTADALASSMVDDVFFILQKCSQRGLATSSLQCVCAILGQVNSLLATNLRSALDARWKGASVRILQGLAASAGSESLGSIPPGGEEASAASAFNNADLSATYATKLKEQLEEMTAELFSSPNDWERIKSVLADVAKTAADFRHITIRALEHLCNGLMPHLRAPLEEVDSSSYVLSEEEYAANEVNATWLDRLLNIMVAIMQWFQPLLTAGNYDWLVATLIAKVVDRLEASMHLKQFNQLGGLQLDRNVRALVATLSEVTQRTVRDKFAKLSQMSTILSLESVGEILDYWGEASDFNWRFTDGQVRDILSQRTDFDRQDIAMLVL